MARALGGSYNGLYDTNVPLLMSWPFPWYRHLLIYDEVVPVPPLLVAYTPISVPENLLVRIPDAGQK